MHNNIIKYIITYQYLLVKNYFYDTYKRFQQKK